MTLRSLFAGFAGPLFSMCTLALSCGGASFPPSTTAADARNDDPWLEGLPCAATNDVGALRIQDVAEGVGKPIEPGDTVRAHYTAALVGSPPFRESRSDGAPIEIIVGSAKTFCGFDKSLVGMKAGGKRRVVVPPALAFGDKGKPPQVPPNTELVLELEAFWPAASPDARGAAPVNPIRGGAGGRRR